MKINTILIIAIIGILLMSVVEIPTATVVYGMEVESTQTIIAAEDRLPKVESTQTIIAAEDRLPKVDYPSDYLGKVALVVVGYLILPSVVVLGVLYTIYVIIRGITKKKPKEQEKEGNQEQGEKEVDGKKK